MIKSIHIENFKSLTDLQIELSPMTVIIGDNASGKSSLLQAIDFMCCSVKEDFENWLERRRLKVEDVRSFINPRKAASFQMEAELQDSEGVTHSFQWKMVLRFLVEKNQVILHSESLFIDGNPRVSIRVSIPVSRAGSVDMLSMKEMENYELHSSSLKFSKKNGNQDELIILFRDFLINSNSYELLSPMDMRLSSRGSGNEIGMSGKNLPSFIALMSEEQKKEYLDKISYVLGEGRFSEVSTVSSSKAGWTKIKTVERYNGVNYSVNSSSISDGTLRILALAAISEIKSSECVLLLDEIENGISVQYAEKVLEILRMVPEEKHHQMILTTHSTVFMDYVDGKNMIYLYRDKNGNTLGVSLFEDKKLSSLLDSLYPGEIILNISQEDLVRKLAKGDESV